MGTIIFICFFSYSAFGCSQVLISQKLKNSGVIVNEYNSGSKNREFWTAFGYLFHIVPGVLGAMYNNSVNKEYMDKVTKIRNEAYSYCEKYKLPDSKL